MCAINTDTKESGLFKSQNVKCNLQGKPVGENVAKFSAEKINKSKKSDSNIRAHVAILVFSFSSQ